MKLIKFDCNNCGAQLEMDLDNLQVYCPYCGQKLLIDIDQVDHILVAREETKQAQEKTKRFQIAQDYKDKKDRRDHCSDAFRTAGMFIILIFCYAYIFFMGHNERKSHQANNDIQISVSSDDLKEEDIDSVVRILENCGFKTINTVNAKDLVFGFLSKENEIDTVAINGDKEFDKGDWFPQDAVVTITYHGFPDKE